MILKGGNQLEYVCDTLEIASLMKQKLLTEEFQYRYCSMCGDYKECENEQYECRYKDDIEEDDLEDFLSDHFNVFIEETTLTSVKLLN